MAKKDPPCLPLIALRQAVREAIILKAKLGQKVVVADCNGNPKVYSARYVLFKNYLESFLEPIRNFFCGTSQP